MSEEVIENPESGVDCEVCERPPEPARPRSISPALQRPSPVPWVARAKQTFNTKVYPESVRTLTYAWNLLKRWAEMSRRYAVKQYTVLNVRTRSYRYRSVVFVTLVILLLFFVLDATILSSTPDKFPMKQQYMEQKKIPFNPPVKVNLATPPQATAKASEKPSKSLLDRTAGVGLLPNIVNVDLDKPSTVAAMLSKLVVKDINVLGYLRQVLDRHDFDKAVVETSPENVANPLKVDKKEAMKYVEKPNVRASVPHGTKVVHHRTENPTTSPNNDTESVYRHNNDDSADHNNPYLFGDLNYAMKKQGIVDETKHLRQLRQHTGKLISRKPQSNDVELLSLLKNYWLRPPSALSYKLTEQNLTDYSKGQSAVVDEILMHKEGGFYVESGALDGESRSNTFFFEMARHWDGLLVEPGPVNYRRMISKHRKAYISPACLAVTPYPTRNQFHRGKNRGRLLDGEDAVDWVKGQYMILDTTDVHCFPLYSLLLALNRTHVDYLSLDVEGVELDVLRTIPFHKVTIDVITVEFAHGRASKDKLISYVTDVLDYVVVAEVTREDWLANDLVLVHKRKLAELKALRELLEVLREQKIAMNDEVVNYNAVIDTVPQPVQQPTKKPLVQQPSQKEPVRDVIVIEPVQDLPVEQSVQDLPVPQPVQDLPVQQPVQQPEQDLPVQQPDQDLPVEQPAQNLPVEQPVQDLPVEQPFKDLPVEQPVQDLPVRQTDQDLPVRQPDQDLPVQQPLQDLPVQQPIQDLPFQHLPLQQPVQDLPVGQPVQGLPVEQPVQDLPVQQTAQELPVQQPVQDRPVEEPVQSLPIQNLPVQQAAQDIPVQEQLIQQQPIQQPLQQQIQDYSAQKKDQQQLLLNIQRAMNNQEQQLPLQDSSQAQKVMPQSKQQPLPQSQEHREGTVVHQPMVNPLYQQSGNLPQNLEPRQEPEQIIAHAPSVQQSQENDGFLEPPPIISSQSLQNQAMEAQQLGREIKGDTIHDEEPSENQVQYQAHNQQLPSEIYSPNINSYLLPENVLKRDDAFMDDVGEDDGK